MAGRHSEPIRGLLAAGRTSTPQGRFGRMFGSLPAAKFGTTEKENHDNLMKLGADMSNSFDAPKDGKDDEESGTPALYTYFGQFVDHDLTFDPISSLRKQDDPDALTDFRDPTFDLDNVYGRGPDDQPYLYDGDKLFLLGKKITGGKKPAFDLPRNSADPARALIGDPRNDENSIVSQLQGLVLRFHNRMVKDHKELTFQEVQQKVQFHYQYVVVNDFLTRIVNSKILNELKTNGRFDRNKLKFFQLKGRPFMPVEFSVAAYRLGHSMIRPGYRLNDHTLLPIFPVASHHLKEGLTGFRAMNPKWGIDWGRFIDIDTRVYDGTKEQVKKRLQFAYRIDTSLVNPLSDLPNSVVPKTDPPPSLAARNLLRGWRMGLPSGQEVAKAMGVKPLADSDILIGAGVDKPDAPLPSIAKSGKVFEGNCPLWTYILAEAMKNMETVQAPVKGSVTITTPRLGPVGGRIVAEVILGLLFADSHSLLRVAPDWHPDNKPQYGLKDFVNYALGN